jgi:thiamine pyrophosphokinase
MKKLLNNHKSIILLNGKIDEKIFPFIKKDVPIISADGSYLKTKLIPNYIIGDFDSSFFKNDKKFIKKENQDITDFEKAILFSKEKNLFPSLVLGINGGEIDHILGNINILFKYCNYPIYFLDTYKKYKIGVKIGTIINKKKWKLKKDITISFFSYFNNFVKTKGLFWELSNVLDENFFSLRNKNKEINLEFLKIEKPLLGIFDISNYI